MPVGKLNRKASNETLDSTLDSRISSADIPKMELLKVNYVHQCKEALMPRSSQQQLPLPQRLNQRFSVPAYKKPPMPEPLQTGHVTKVMVGAQKPTVAMSPPPTVESWNLMQNADHASTPKFIVKSPLSDSDDNEQSDTVSCCSSYCSSSTCTELDACASVDCQVSNSWDYRKNAATRDLRRELARNGIKSRADRIAIIERTDCDHLQTHADMDVVSRINQLFASSGAKQRNPLGIPPQPLRLAPQPFKEPNMRRRPYSVTPTTTNDCSCPSPDAKQRTNSLDNRKRASGPVETKLSRIPKPISVDHLMARDKNEQLQERIRKMFEQGSAQNRKYTPQTDITAMLKAGKSMETLIDEKPDNKQQQQKQHEFDHKLLRNACQSYGVDHHKAKVERIHIRKKRQPLLIINQLNGDDECQRKVAALDSQYKSCQYTDNGEDQLKRLSLESGSDSGVSSAADRCEQIKENNLKNLEKCSDCVNILENQHTAYVSEHNVDYAISELEEQKIKEIEEVVGLPIKIQVRKSQNDPNDVQNFANKSLTKISTDELMNTTKQFKLNNDVKNIEANKHNNKLQTTTIHIDEDWVQEPTEALNELGTRKPINCSDNSVKIFVSANVNAHDTHSRSSCASALSYASQTSGCSSAASTISSSSTTSTNRSSLCEYQPVRPPKSQQSTPPQIPPRRRNNKDVRFSATPTSIDGIFWNNSYFSTVEEELHMLSDSAEDNCCCSISSCEDDNCSFYETSCSSMTDRMKTPPPQLRKKSSYLQTAQHDCLLGDRYTQPLDLKQKQKQQQQHSMLHNDSIEDILIRNNKLLRKVSVAVDRDRDYDRIILTPTLIIIICASL